MVSAELSKIKLENVHVRVQQEIGEVGTKLTPSERQSFEHLVGAVLEQSDFVYDDGLLRELARSVSISQVDWELGDGIYSDVPEIGKQIRAAYFEINMVRLPFHIKTFEAVKEQNEGAPSTEVHLDFEALFASVFDRVHAIVPGLASATRQQINKDLVDEVIRRSQIAFDPRFKSEIPKETAEKFLDDVSKKVMEKGEELLGFQGKYLHKHSESEIQKAYENAYRRACREAFREIGFATQSEDVLSVLNALYGKGGEYYAQYQEEMRTREGELRSRIVELSKKGEVQRSRHRDISKHDSTVEQ